MHDWTLNITKVYDGLNTTYELISAAKAAVLSLLELIQTVFYFLEY